MLGSLFGLSRIHINLLKISDIASNNPACPATPPNATTLKANAKITGIGTPKICRSISLARG